VVGVGLPFLSGFPRGTARYMGVSAPVRRTGRGSPRSGRGTARPSR
jgi:hypothetical protein